MSRADVIVIGAGIAGASAAAAMAEHARIILLEMEAQPGYHATGRSAAFFAPSYGNAVVRRLTAASETFYREPPADFTEVPLLRPRENVFIARADQMDRLRAMHAEIPALQPLSGTAVCRRVPILDPAYVHAGLRDESGGDLDVDAILQAFLRLFRRRGGQLVTDARVSAVAYRRGSWQLEAAGTDYAAPIVVNAAGAWADTVAAQAGIGTLGIQPKRRTALLLETPADVDIADWPLVVDVDEAFYFKPDAGVLLLSPADETPSPPCDAQPEELDVAVAVDRFEQATGREVKRVTHRWAGLRSFAPDKTFVVGFDPRAEGFFWLAGQGGYGVQSAPALAHLSSALVTGTTAAGFEATLELADAVSPDRLIGA